MNRTILRISKLLITVMMLSALIFTGCSCGGKKDDNKTTDNRNKGVAATVIGEDGSVVYIEDITDDSKDNVKGSSDDENINDLVGSGNSKSKKTDSKKSSGKKSSSKKSSNEKSTNKNSSSNDNKKSDGKKSDSGKKIRTRRATIKKRLLRRAILM